MVHSFTIEITISLTDLLNVIIEVLEVDVFQFVDLVLILFTFFIIIFGTA